MNRKRTFDSITIDTNYFKYIPYLVWIFQRNAYDKTNHKDHSVSKTSSILLFCSIQPTFGDIPFSQEPQNNEKEIAISALFLLESPPFHTQ